VPLVVYASLHPFSGWRDRGLPPFAFLTAPFPRPIPVFDVVANIIGYMPLGFLAVLAVYPGCAAVTLWVRPRCSVSLSFASSRCSSTCLCARPRIRPARQYRGGAVGASPPSPRRGPCSMPKTAAPAQQAVPSGAHGRSRVGFARANGCSRSSIPKRCSSHRDLRDYSRRPRASSTPRSILRVEAGVACANSLAAGLLACALPHAAAGAGRVVIFLAAALALHTSDSASSSAPRTSSLG